VGIVPLTPELHRAMLYRQFEKLVSPQAVATRNWHLICSLFCLVGRNDGRVPDFNCQWTIIQWRLTGGFVKVQNIGLAAVHDFNGPYPHGVAPARSQFWCAAGGTL
jgi:hypothetical protein